MQLLDAILAFALTMAALATIVTVIMEACLRVARMRKKNFIEVMKLLNRELGKGTLKMTKDERWKFFVRVVNNPAEAAIAELAPGVSKLPPSFKKKSIEGRIAEFGRDKTAGIAAPRRMGRFLKQLFLGDKMRAGLYEKVSLEYMLRCLAESRSIKQASITAGETLKVEFNRIARKYEEFGSSVSASFKHHAQAWSIGIGIVLALVANIDGLRIFEAYRVDPGLAAAVIEQQDKFIQNHQNAQGSLDEFNRKLTKFQKAVKEKSEELDKAKKDKREEAVLAEKEKALAEAEAVLENQIALKNIQQTAQRAQQQLVDLVALGVPLGWKLYPNCPYGGTLEQWSMSSPKCKAIPEGKRGKIVGFERFGGRIVNTAGNDLAGFFLWLFVVVGTGVLIGLGAPFWFDIAKRLSQIRKGLQSTAASTEYRLSANDANGDYKKRKEIVENVLADAAGEAAAKATEGAGKRRAFFDLKGGNHDRIT